jgi:hypothetical protein
MNANTANFNIRTMTLGHVAAFWELVLKAPAMTEVAAVQLLASSADRDISSTSHAEQLLESIRQTHQNFIDIKKKKKKKGEAVVDSMSDRFKWPTNTFKEVQEYVEGVVDKGTKYSRLEFRADADQDRFWVTRVAIGKKGNLFNELQLAVTPEGYQHWDADERSVSVLGAGELHASTARWDHILRQLQVAQVCSGVPAELLDAGNLTDYWRGQVGEPGRVRHASSPASTCPLVHVPLSKKGTHKNIETDDDDAY